MGLRQLKFAFLAVLLAGVTAPAAGQHATSRAEREAGREQWQRVGDVFTAMGVRPGARVADVGAGDGFFTARLSKAVGPEGKVFAVDVANDALRRLRSRVAEDNLSNVEVVEGAVDDPRLPPGSLDAILVVNAYHEMTAHAAMLAHMKAALRPDGRLVIIEPISDARRDGTRAEQTKSHEIAVHYVQEDARHAGFRQVGMEDRFYRRPRGHDDHWLLVLTPAVASAGAANAWSASKKANWLAADLRISPQEYKRLAAAEDVLVLDVRDEPMYRDGHLPGAVLLTVEEIAGGEALDRLRTETRPIVTYCSCEIEQTSARVALILRQAGVRDARALVGGFEDWVRRGEPVEKSR